MIRVSVTYPRAEGARFDMDYFVNKHIPLVQEKCGDGLKGAAIDAGIAGGMQGQPSAYVGVAHLMFDSLDTFRSSMGPHMPEIMGDIPNYTDITPVLEISEVKL